MAPRTQDATEASAPRGKGPAGPQEIGDVERATTAELAALGVDKETSALAASTLELARQLDNPRNSATAKSMCAARLLEGLDRLIELNPPESEDTPLDQLKARRTARIAAATG